MRRVINSRCFLVYLDFKVEGEACPDANGREAGRQVKCGEEADSLVNCSRQCGAGSFKCSEVKVKGVTLRWTACFAKRPRWRKSQFWATYTREGWQQGGGTGEVRRRRGLLEATVATSEIRGNQFECHSSLGTELQPHLPCSALDALWHELHRFIGRQASKQASRDD